MSVFLALPRPELSFQASRPRRCQKRKKKERKKKEKKRKKKPCRPPLSGGPLSVQRSSPHNLSRLAFGRLIDDAAGKQSASLGISGLAIRHGTASLLQVSNAARSGRCARLSSRATVSLPKRAAIWSVYSLAPLGSGSRSLAHPRPITGKLPSCRPVRGPLFCVPAADILVAQSRPREPWRREPYLTESPLASLPTPSPFRSKCLLFFRGCGGLPRTKTDSGPCFMDISRPARLLPAMCDFR